jgi:hypothetical protein
VKAENGGACAFGVEKRFSAFCGDGVGRHGDGVGRNRDDGMSIQLAGVA